MNCVYCQNQLEDKLQVGYFECKNHKVNVNYLLSGNTKDYKIWYTTFSFKRDDTKYGIALCYMDGNSIIRRYDTGNNAREICKFPYILNVNPDNVEEKLNTILTFL